MKIRHCNVLITYSTFNGLYLFWIFLCWVVTCCIRLKYSKIQNIVHLNLDYISLHSAQSVWHRILLVPAYLQSSTNGWGQQIWILSEAGGLCLLGHSGGLNKDSSWDRTDGYSNSHHEMGYWMHSSRVYTLVTRLHTLISNKHKDSAGNRFGFKNQMTWIIKSYKKKYPNSQQLFNESETESKSWTCHQVTDLLISLSHFLFYQYQNIFLISFKPGMLKLC